VNGRIDYVLDSTALHKVVQKGSDARLVERMLQGLQLNVIAWSESLAYRSAEFATFGKSHGLSLGDRACLALAKQLRATAVTADGAWRQVPGLGVRLLMFRS